MISTPSLEITALCKAAQINRSCYYYFIQNQPKKIIKDAPTVKLIKEYAEKSNYKDGIQMIDMKIRLDCRGVVNHKKIARIKIDYGIPTLKRSRNPYKNLPKTLEEHVQIPNILNRDFTIPLPDHVYATDMTYLYYGSCQKAYLSLIKDLATNEIVSFKLMKTAQVRNFTAEMRELLTRLKPEARANLIVHSDQGFQYTHSEYRNLLREMSVTQSMSRRGNPIDNASMESTVGHLKDEMDLKRCFTYEKLNREIERVVEYYNNKRPQMGLNKKPPVLYRGLLNGFF